MHNLTDNSPSPRDHAALVTDAVRTGSRRRVRDVSASHERDVVIVRGRADSYFALQLAIQAVRPWLDASSATPVRLAIEVDAAAD